MPGFAHQKMRTAFDAGQKIGFIYLLEDGSSKIVYGQEALDAMRTRPADVIRTPRERMRLAATASAASVAPPFSGGESE